jgi:hypothetical protein
MGNELNKDRIIEILSKEADFVSYVETEIGQTIESLSEENLEYVTDILGWALEAGYTEDFHEVGEGGDIDKFFIVELEDEETIVLQAVFNNENKFVEGTQIFEYTTEELEEKAVGYRDYLNELIARLNDEEVED